MKVKTLLSLALACALAALHADVATPPQAPQPPAPRGPKQCRSVHLFYNPLAPHATGLEGTVRVATTAPRSYFAILCFDRGYCGIQDLGDNRHIFIFSVWDPGNTQDFKARADKVAEDIRAKIVYLAPGTEGSRFGGEGTGAKTMTPFDWQVGEPISARLEVAPDGERSAFTCFVKKGNDGEWKKIATLSTLGAQAEFGNAYSFVEDFGRNYVSAQEIRRAEFGGVRSRTDASAPWVTAARAWFTGDNTQLDNVDAGRVADGFFFLQTGGATRNDHVKLWSVVE